MSDSSLDDEDDIQICRWIGCGEVASVWVDVGDDEDEPDSDRKRWSWRCVRLCAAHADEFIALLDD